MFVWYRIHYFCELLYDILALVEMSNNMSFSEEREAYIALGNFLQNSGIDAAKVERQIQEMDQSILDHEEKLTELRENRIALITVREKLAVVTITTKKQSRKHTSPRELGEKRMSFIVSLLEQANSGQVRLITLFNKIQKTSLRFPSWARFQAAIKRYNKNDNNFKIYTNEDNGWCRLV